MSARNRSSLTADAVDLQLLSTRTAAHHTVDEGLLRWIESRILADMILEISEALRRVAVMPFLLAAAVAWDSVTGQLRSDEQSWAV